MVCISVVAIELFGSQSFEKMCLLILSFCLFRLRGKTTRALHTPVTSLIVTDIITEGPDSGVTTSCFSLRTCKGHTAVHVCVVGEKEGKIRCLISNTPLFELAQETTLYGVTCVPCLQVHTHTHTEGFHRRRQMKS